MKQHIRNQLIEMYNQIGFKEPVTNKSSKKEEVLGHINYFSTHEYRKVIL